jgi:branched-chain amino acid transport system substrate-binding protein
MIRRRHFVSVAAAGPWVLRTGLARSATRARVGLSLPLTGVQGGVAEELLAGYRFAFKSAQGAGLEIDAVVEDDQSQAAKTLQAIERFGRDATITAASGLVGTPHAKAAIPAARLAGLPVVGLRSGASELRDGGELVYHLRHSYEAELHRMIEMLGTTEHRLSIVASEDSFGVPLAKYVERIASQRRMRVVKIAGAERNGQNVRPAVAAATDPALQATALLVLMITTPAIEGVRAARANAFLGPVFTMSFTAGAQLAKAGPEVFRGLGLVSAFPVPRFAQDETSESFRNLALAAGRADLADSVTVAEGFWYGQAITRALMRCGDRVSRSALVQALETTPGVRVGGERLAFDRERVGRRYLQVLYVDSAGTLRA